MCSTPSWEASAGDAVAFWSRIATLSDHGDFGATWSVVTPQPDRSPRAANPVR